MRNVFSLAHPIHLVVGLTIWGIWFVIIYGGLSVACTVAPPAPEQGALTYINIGVGALTLATTALLLWLTVASCRTGRRQQNKRERFMAVVSAGIYLFTAFATLFTGAPVIGLPPCL